MKKFLLTISLLLISCADTIATKNLAVTNSIPSEWKYEIPNSTEIAGKWWEAFDDSTLDNVFQEFHSNSPDLKSIASRLEAAKQVYKISSSIRLPSVNLGLTGSSRKQNLTAFGLSEDFLEGVKMETRTLVRVMLQVLAPVILV